MAVEKTITLRDNKKPSAETVKKCTLYSNKTGKKVSMDYSDTISGTEIRMIGAWAQMGAQRDKFTERKLNGVYSCVTHFARLNDNRG